MASQFRRSGTLLAAAALTLTTLAASPLTGAASAAPPSYDDQPGTAAASWLTGQLTDGVVHNDEHDFDDIGLSADVALGLAAAGGHATTLDAIADAVEPRAKDEWYTSTFEGVTTLYAGSLAKAVVFAQTTGREPTAFGGENLVSTLESHVASAPPIVGRIEDENNGFGDSNVIGQAYAAEALTVAGSGRAADVTAYLLQQQCSEGYFRLDFTEDKTAPDQTCDGGVDAGDSPADTDVTALAVLALQDNPLAAGEVADAVSWLEGQQHVDGSFGGGPSTEASNTNSTGLSGWALGTIGNDDAAARAAGWVRRHQAVNAGTCTPFGAADLGGLAYDDAGLVAGQLGGITDLTADQWRRATSQALPVLAWAPDGAGPADVVGAGDYVRAGRKVTVGVDNVAPGDSVCLASGSRTVLERAGRSGRAVLRIKLPHGTATRVATVSDSSARLGKVRFRALDGLRIPFRLDGSVARRDKQVVKVRGLAPAELVSVLFRGERVDLGQADGNGRFTGRFKVLGAPGTAKVTVLGQFPGIRRNAKTFTVTR